MNHLNDDNLRTGFMIAQKVNLDCKQEKADSRIKYYALTAAGIGASPIPMSDAVLLTGLQVMMASDIFSIYGLNNSLSNTIKMIIQGRVISILGKTVAGNLLKLIPGFGTAAGAAINAAVASTITYSLGYALSALCKKAVENEWNVSSTVIDELFTEENVTRLMDEYKKNKK